MPSIHGLFANLLILFLFISLFFDFIGFLRPPKFYPLLAMFFLFLAILSFLPLVFLGLSMAHTYYPHGHLPNNLNSHIMLAGTTTLLLFLTIIIRFLKGKNVWRIGLYFVLGMITVALAAVTAHAGSSFAMYG